MYIYILYVCVGGCVCVRASVCAFVRMGGWLFACVWLCEGAFPCAFLIPFLLPSLTRVRLQLAVMQLEVEELTAPVR